MSKYVNMRIANFALGQLNSGNLNHELLNSVFTRIKLLEALILSIRTIGNDA